MKNIQTYFSRKLNKQNNKILFILKIILFVWMFILSTNTVFADNLNDIELSISSDGIIPSFIISCANASSTGATQYLIGDDSGSLYKSYGVIQRVPCIEGVASFESVNIKEKFDIALSGIPFESWGIYYSFPQRMFVKDTTGLCDYLCNLYGAFNNYNLGSMLPEDGTWNTLVRGPSFKYDGLFWSNSSSTQKELYGLSNVLFLPGLEASRLYRHDYNGGTDQLWEPNTNNDVEDLFLNEDGESIRNDVYTKDVIDEGLIPYAGPNIYQSFIEQMRELKTNNTIADWQAVPYDWRLSPEDILNNGNKLSDGRIYYAGDLAATSSPYIIQELRRLAKSSKTGKVTIVAHSNGGLVTKALTDKLGNEASTLIDKIIFIAVPQAGTPQAVGALLHGYDQGLPFDSTPFILTPETARTLAKNMPSAYNLVPSENYFTYVDDPVVTFEDKPALAEFRTRYGSEINSEEQLRNFITDTRRLASSTPSNLVYPSVGNSVLLSGAEALHIAQDAWVPPPGVQLYEIAGWGEDTLATIMYYEGKKKVCSQFLFTACIRFITVPTILYKPYEVVEGDGTVVVPSALWTASSTDVKKYWVNLREYGASGFGPMIDREHADILEVPQLRTFINNILSNSILNIPQFISTTQPIAKPNDDRLRFILHSPLNLSATDNLGNVVNSATSTIPGSRFKHYGEVQVLTVPKSTPLTLNLDGYATGSFTLDIEEIDGNNTIIASSTLSAIPSATSTQASMLFADGTLQNASPLLVDYNGDTQTDFILTPQIGEIITLDTTPPEAIVSFSTTTKKLNIYGIDETSNTTVSITATSSNITDQAGNTLSIPLSKFKEKNRQTSLTFNSLVYNGITTKVSNTNIKYKWNTNKKGEYTLFAVYIKIGNTKFEAHYRPKKNITVIMEKPTEFDDSDSDDDADVRPVRQKLPGMVIPSIKTENGSVRIDY
ncbi:MAG: lipase/acyltransferase domain-containing protein [Minisyncoccota bacterium]